MRKSLTLLPIHVLKKVWRFRRYLQQNVSSETLLLGSIANAEST